MSYYTVQMHDGELYHHGILGMKWGKRQGPPYPLDASDHSSAEKKAGWRKSLGATVQKLGQSNVNRATSKARAKQAYKSGKIDKAEYKQKLKDADAKNHKETREALGLNKSRAERAAEAAKRDADNLRKAGYTKEADAVQKVADKNKAKAEKKAEKEKQKNAYKNVDPNIAKNKQSRRAALDYNNLSDRQFKAKYKTSKDKFAKRYERTKGDTYSLGKKKAMAAAVIIATTPSIPYYDVRNHKVRQTASGTAAAAKLLARDLGVSQIQTNFGYKRAEKKYNKNN